MKIVSWNVNSIKARGEHVKRYLLETAPDVLMVQELKGLEFPAAEFEAMGYHTAAVCQKAYNGVAVFSKTPLTVIAQALSGDEADEQARYMEFETGGLRLINIYLPNGNPVESEKYPYKLRWMERLKSRLQELREEMTDFAIGGDFNVIPEDRDCWDPAIWADDALFKIETRRQFRKFLNLGLTEAYRAHNGNVQEYTFWDYQAGRWQKNQGIRIDHFLLSPGYADRLISCHIDKSPRGWDKPSDHTPVMVQIGA